MIQEHQEDVKQPRSCELCQNKRAVWYCASDDAFLCHGCDESVHSANQVVKKHERVWLRTNEIPNDMPQGTTISKPIWHSGFRRKPRTPRMRCERKTTQKIEYERRREDPCVPEIGCEGMFFNDEDLTSLVPEFQGFVSSNHDDGNEERTRHFNFEVDDLYCTNEGDEACLEEQSCKNDYDNVMAITTKTEDMEDYESHAKQRNMLLRLNYENVIAAWEDKKESPRRIQSDSNSTSNFQLVPPGMEGRGKSEREARVWRYRDKRKNRLFEKKIRYEVRKVNADKRPRLKGRFVRRS